MSREPETLTELKAEILRQLKMDVLTVTIKLTEGDSIHELLESITDGIEGTIELRQLMNDQHNQSEQCSRCAELEQEMESIKAILSDAVAVHSNLLRGTIARISDADVKHLYPHLFTPPPNPE